MKEATMVSIVREMLGVLARRIQQGGVVLSSNMSEMEEPLVPSGV